ncbi:MAG: hypothetical protein J6U58_05760 [Bacteroidaceae bacterium]|nr:hypothetical protein [Bacteroidaceae bacterium]
MFKKGVIIISAEEKNEIGTMCRSVLSQISMPDILKITFFYQAANDKEYLENTTILTAITKEHFQHDTPLVSYVAQKSASGTLVAEVTYLHPEQVVCIESHNQYKLLKNNDCTEIITAGIIPANISKSTFEQANEIFSIISSILQSNGFLPSDIYRQWNYIQGITMLNDGRQNYQEFNEARSRFYNNCNWENGYPAATGIGCDAGGLMVEICAARCNNQLNKPIDNPLQIAAHNYSQDVLEGKAYATLQEKSTPKFERARILGDTIYISGTAAIKGEASNNSCDIIEQTAETMEVMNRLISKENIPTDNNGAEYKLLRIYVKREEDISAITKYMQEHYPATPKHYTIADICRPELIVEIEGVANI